MAAARAWSSTQLPTRLRRLRELVWPRLEKPTAVDQAAAAQSLVDDRKAIAALDFDREPETALDEARRVSDAESARRAGADQKAATYLAVVAALVPLILTVATAVWDQKAGSAPTGVNMLLLGAAVIHVCAAGWWAFRVLEVSAANRLGVTDFKAAWAKPQPKEQLARSLLYCTRLNRVPINRKVDGIKMTHAFLLRAFLTFALLLLFNIAWFFGAAAFDWARPKPQPGLDSPGRALAASAAVAELRDRISAARSATSALDRWCVEHRMAPGHAVVADKQANRIVTPSAQLARRLAAAAAEPVRFRQVELRCGSHALSSARLWYVPSRLPPAVEASLRETDTPFGRAVAPLGLVRTNIASTRFWPATSTTPSGRIPAVLFRQTALLVRADGAPIAYVVEDYRRGVLEFGAQPEPTR